MTNNFYEGDFLRISDRFEKITLHRNGGATETINAIRMPVRKTVRNGEKSVINFAGYLKWYLPKNCEFSPPRSDDKIIDSNGNIWIVTYAESSIDKWIITTYNDKCVGSFANILVLEKPIFSKTASGDQLITWTPISQGFFAKILMIETKWSNTNDGAKMTRILLPGKIPLEQGLRLHSSDDRIFTIKSFRFSTIFPGMIEVDAETAI